MIIPPLNNQRQFHSVFTAVSFHFAVRLFKNIGLKFIISTISTHFNLNIFNVYLVEIILFLKRIMRGKKLFLLAFIFSLYFCVFWKALDMFFGMWSSLIWSTSSKVGNKKRKVGNTWRWKTICYFSSST